MQLISLTFRVFVPRAFFQKMPSHLQMENLLITFDYRQ